MAWALDGIDAAEYKVNMSQVSTDGISRRRLLGAGAAAGTGALLAGVPGAEAAKKKKKATKKPRRADVVVVGGGLAGLTAAREVRKAGHSVILLEARTRVGGRCFSQPIAGASDVANMGATFVGPTQTKILALMSELGIGKFPVYSTGKLLWYEDGKNTPYTGTIPPSSDPLAVIQLGTVTLPQIDQMARTVPLDAPWTAPNALAWDSMTVDTWSAQNILTAKGRDVFALAVEAVLSAEARDVSFLYFLFYIHSAGGINQLVGNAGTGAGQDFRVSGGTQGIADAMAKQLGKRVLRGQPVRSISQSGGSVTVHTDTIAVKARQAIVAIPPHLAGRIAYSPGLPAQRDQLTQRMPIGSLIKTIAVYDKPFWRDEGLNGQVTSDLGPVKAMFDASPASGTPGVLLGFVDGEDARLLSDSSPAERQAKALESYVRYFGSAAAKPKQYIDQAWDREIYTGGCPVGMMPPGVMTSYGRSLRPAVGRIHWAGTETATVWNGYMDGAVQSGQRAAQEVLAGL